MEGLQPRLCETRGTGLLTREMYASHSEAPTVAGRSQPNESAFLPVVPTQARDIPLSAL